jgi:hypothetical protein
LRSKVSKRSSDPGVNDRVFIHQVDELVDEFLGALFRACRRTRSSSWYALSPRSAGGAALILLARISAARQSFRSAHAET